MPVREFIPTNLVKDRLGAFTLPVDKLIDLDGGKKVVSYTGCVLETFERNMASASDFYAVVWDARTGTCRAICYATTSGYSTGGADIDATEEVKALARDWLYEWYVKHLTSGTEHESGQIKVGRYAEFSKPYNPRKVGNIPVKVGQLVYILRLALDTFSRSGKVWNAEVLFVEGDAIGKTAWHSTGKLEIVFPEHYQRERSDIEQLAKQHADSENWRTPFSPFAYLR